MPREPNPLTMADLIGEIERPGGNGSILQGSLKAALGKTGPVYHAGNMWYVRNNTVNRTPLRHYRPESGATSFDVHPADQIPIPSL